MRRLRRLGLLVTTIGSGLAIGLVVTALVAPVLPGPTKPGDRHEPAETRGYINALLRSDGAAINKLQLPRNVVDRAAVLKQFEDALNLPGQTLTYLGGMRVGQIGQFGYVLTVDNGDGSSAAIPIVLTTIGDKIWYLRGGSTGGEESLAAPSQAPSPAAG